VSFPARLVLLSLSPSLHPPPLDPQALQLGALLKVLKRMGQVGNACAAGQARVWQAGSIKKNVRVAISRFEELLRCVLRVGREGSMGRMPERKEVEKGGRMIRRTRKLAAGRPSECRGGRLAERDRETGGRCGCACAHCSTKQREYTHHLA
jgi:hypothetical protein